MRYRLTRLKVESRSLDSGIADDSAIDPAPTDRTGDILNLLLIEIRGDLDDHLGLQRLLDDQVVPLGNDLTQEPGQEILALQAAQSGSVGRRDVDDEHVGVRTEQTDTGKVILVGIRGRRLVLSEVDREQAPGPERTGQRCRRERVQRQWLGKEGRVIACE